MPWNLNGDTPIYSQIIEHIKLRIAIGELKAGDKLLPVRELAAEAAVNPNTMQKALAELERQGFVYSQRTSGRFITEETDKIKTLRETLAGEQIEYFLKKMNSLGYTKEDAIDLLKNYNIGEELS